MTGNFLKLMLDTKPQIQAAQRTPSRINANKSYTWHIIFKLQKKRDKGKTSKEARGEKHLTYRAVKIKIISNFSSETMYTKESGVKYLKC